MKWIRYLAGSRVHQGDRGESRDGQGLQQRHSGQRRVSMSDDMDRGRDDILEALQAFLDEHRRCGELRSDVVDLPNGEARVDAVLWRAAGASGVKCSLRI